MAAQWEPDDLGEGFEKLTLTLPDDSEGHVVATLVRYWPTQSAVSLAATADTITSTLAVPASALLPGATTPQVSFAPVARSSAETPPAIGLLPQVTFPESSVPQPVRVVLYLHGWSDYFFQRKTAEFFHRQGIRFYALDLRKYGRSLRPHHTPGYVNDLAIYDEDMAAAMSAVQADLDSENLLADFGLFAHSTGGLTAALWADRHPGKLSALILNSAWLEVQGSYMVRDAALPLFEQISRRHPLSAIPNVDLGFNYRTVSAKADGEWNYNEQWRPPVCFPVRSGWLKAILSGHASVAEGLNIDAPVLSMTSARSMVQARWNEKMHEADVVLEAPVVAQRSVNLAPTVTVSRFDGGLHDLVLSKKPVRDKVYEEMAQWIHTYWPPPELVAPPVFTVPEPHNFKERFRQAREAFRRHQ